MPRNGAIVMAGQKAVKPLDHVPWIPLLAEYRLTSLAEDTVLEGTLRPELCAASPEVLAAIANWPAPAYLQHEDGVTQVVLVYESRPAESRLPWMHAALFAATLLTTLGAGALMAGLDPFSTQVLRLGDVDIPYPSRIDWVELMRGASFALPFLGVLLAHEMGHYTAARVHRVRASLPYFIPFPPYFSIIGTVGAFIRLKGPMVRRAVLFDVGSSGPFASFIVSLPLLAIGFGLSTRMPGEASLTTPFAIEFVGQTVWLGNGLVTHVLATLFAPGAVGESLVRLHPLALVGWLGLFVTALNLLPLGQLDGGHILYALAPERHRRAARAFLLLLIPLGVIWWGWWAWGLLVLVVNRGRVDHPTVIQRQEGVGSLRRGLGWVLIAIFFLTLIPVPLHL
jgi:membrane-associated protease RseP (regulator of RpoE activity)